MKERTTIWIDAEVKQQTKLKAMANRTTISSVIEDLLSRYLKSMKDGIGKNGKGK